MTRATPMTIFVMGVAGSGKSTVGAALAAHLGFRFIEGDALHPRENIKKMTRGIALDEADRAPWLASIALAIGEAACESRGIVVACSALRERHRRLLDPHFTARFVHLVAARDLLARRLSERAGHFFPPDLLDSQLDALEPPADALVIDAALPIDDAVAAIRAHLDL